MTRHYSSGLNVSIQVDAVMHSLDLADSRSLTTMRKAPMTASR